MAPRGGMMVGMSRTVREGVARGYELATIRVGDDGRLVYHAEPSGQSPADFPAHSVEDGRLEFVNAEHDFPQKIIYSRSGRDAILAAVFGKARTPSPPSRFLISEWSAPPPETRNATCGTRISYGPQRSQSFKGEIEMSGQGSAGNVIAALASFFIPGLGQLLQGRVLKAAFMFVLAGGVWLITLGTFGWIIHLWSVIDAAVYRRKW